MTEQHVPPSPHEQGDERYPDTGPRASRDPANEAPDNFKRTPPPEAVEHDPQGAGRRFTSNQVLALTLAVALLAALALAIVYL